MRPALAYSPGRSPLHRASARVAVAFLGSFALVALAFSNPLILLADGIAIVLAGIACGAWRALKSALRLALPLMFLMGIVNVLVSHRGETVLLRGWELPVIGNTDVTLESLADGAQVGMRVVVVILAFAVYSACVDPDRVLRALRPVARRSAMTAALVARLVPLAAADLVSMREAAALRGPGASPVGRTVMARRLLEGSLDRSVDVAATLELRGHSLPVRRGRGARRREPAGPAAALVISALAVVAGGVALLITEGGGFDPYPTLWVDTGTATLLCCALLPLAALAGTRDA